MCRLMCHCVRHISLDNKHGRSVEAIYSSRHAGRLARSSVPAKQEEPSDKKSSIGSEDRQRCSRRFRTSVMVRSVPPRFDRAGPKTRRLSATLCVLPAREEQILQDISTRSDICAVIFGVILPRHDGVLIPLGAPLTVLAPYRDLLAGRLFLFCGAR